VRVKVYYNLHKKLFSVVALAGPRKGRVIAHKQDLILTCVTFKVQESGRQRVLREKQKNVHAFVVGEWRDVCYYFPESYGIDTRQICYNPYKYDSFVLKDSEEPVSSARVVWLSGKTIKAVDILKK